jgi:hypothetical protein
MEQQSKQRVLELLVDFLSDYAPLPDQRVATLGGKGCEAVVWRQKGVRPENAWLIERDASRARKLVSRHPSFCHIYGDLNTFAEAIRRQYFGRATLDFFHWDLCGTVEPVLKDIRVVLPLLATGFSKCLAVTVADSRRNLSIENPKSFRELCDVLLSDAWKGLNGKLVAQHAELVRLRDSLCADPNKSALRETATLLFLQIALSSLKKRDGRYSVTEMPQFFKSGEIPSTEKEAARLRSFLKMRRTIVFPEHLERILYWSNKSGFRMRTYFLHFKVLKRSIPLAEAAAQIARLLVKTPCMVVHENRVQRLVGPETPAPVPASVAPVPTPPATAKEEVVMSQKLQAVAALRKQFAPVMALFNPQLRKSFDDLCALAERNAAPAAVVPNPEEIIRIFLEEALKKLGGKSLNGASATAAAAGVPAANGEKPNGKRTKKGPTLPPTDVCDVIRLRILRAHAAGEKAEAAETAKVMKELGLSRRANRNHVLGGVMAHVNGKFQKGFVTRVVSAHTDEQKRQSVLAELAKLLGMTTDKLQALVNK